MKKFLITTIAALAISLSAYSQTLNLETKKLPEFTQKADELPYVQNSKTYFSGFKSANFKYIERSIILADCTYYLCYDNNSKTWIVFAVYLRKYNLWHINTKFVHLLIFEKDE